MFWGLIIEPNKRYSQTVERSFHVSMASLDASTSNEEIVQVMLCYEHRNYLLCTLKKDTTWQVPLDLNFQEGTKISFSCNGHGHVHLTGYLIPEDEDEDLDLDHLDEEEEEEEEEEDEEAPELSDKRAKRKAVGSPKENAKKQPKRIKQEQVEDEDEDEDDDEDSSDDDDLTLGKLVEEDEDSEEDEEDDEDEEDEEEVEAAKTKPQQQQQQKKKKENEKKAVQEPAKLLNGKEAKKKNKEEQQEQQQQQQKGKKRVVEGGVQVEDVKIGNGPPAKAGRFVSVYYVGRLKNGKKFDSTTQGDGFKFRLGKGEVIKGWDVGISGMKVGGKRRITIPPAMGYGAKGSPPVIPGNSVLIFEVELKNVH